MTEKAKISKTSMVDVSAKKATKRVAVAQGEVQFSSKSYALLTEGKSPKGNVIEAAKIAGIMAAKATPAIIPMCHPLELGKVDVVIVLDDKTCRAVVTCSAAYKGKTGVEMEALTGVSAACLTIYDMMKWADKGMLIKNIKLLSKSGGKSGDYKVAS